jgi:hypothetical protein
VTEKGEERGCVEGEEGTLAKPMRVGLLRGDRTSCSYPVAFLKLEPTCATVKPLRRAASQLQGGMEAQRSHIPQVAQVKMKQPQTIKSHLFKIFFLAIFWEGARGH